MWWGVTQVREGFHLLDAVGGEGEVNAFCEIAQAISVHDFDWWNLTDKLHDLRFLRRLPMFLLPDHHGLLACGWF